MKILKRLLGLILLLVVILAVVYFTGPIANAPNFNNHIQSLNVEFEDIEAYVKDKESKVGAIKADNEARIVWYDSIPSKTEYSVVYLHGFGASQGEGAPVHINLADSLKANLFLARLAKHGLEAKDAFVGITPEAYMASAAEAVEIGKIIGKKVIIVATSTGGTQALYLASQFPENIAALVLYSPFIELADQNLQKLSVGPWHDEITELMIGNEISYTERPDSVSAYWSSYYHVDAYKSLFTMVKHSASKEVLENVHIPVFIAYYYQDENNQDDVVSVSAIQKAYDLIASENKKEIAFPKTGDHVIASKWRSYDWLSVQDSTLAFLKAKLTINN